MGQQVKSRAPAATFKIAPAAETASAQKTPADGIDASVAFAGS